MTSAVFVVASPLTMCPNCSCRGCKEDRRHAARKNRALDCVAEDHVREEFVTDSSQNPYVFSYCQTCDPENFKWHKFASDNAKAHRLELDRKRDERERYYEAERAKNRLARERMSGRRRTWDDSVSALPIDTDGGECFVYAIRGDESLKIGIARSVPDRLKSLQTGNAHHLEIVWQKPMANTTAARMLERQIHQHFEKSRLKGEWFRAADVIQHLNAVDVTLDADGLPVLVFRS